MTHFDNCWRWQSWATNVQIRTTLALYFKTEIQFTQDIITHCCQEKTGSSNCFPSFQSVSRIFTALGPIITNYSYDLQVIKLLTFFRIISTQTCFQLDAMKKIISCCQMKMLLEKLQFLKNSEQHVTEPSLNWNFGLTSISSNCKIHILSFSANLGSYSFNKWQLLDC